ncbi:hypothetical protein BDD12DRAFT_823126 [Trichophaea hybrida]|nr:hypothetical protein BDD12DRAFT_823126 [Trichophaea hybrida]
MPGREFKICSTHTFASEILHTCSHYQISSSLPSSLQGQINRNVRDTHTHCNNSNHFTQLPPRTSPGGLFHVMMSIPYTPPRLWL